MKRKYFFIILTLFIVFIYVTNITQLPSKVFLLNGEKLNVKTVFGIEIKETKKEIQETWQNQNLQTTQMDVTILGGIKVKEISVTTYPSIKVVPTGNLIGLKLYTNGVLVIGTSEIQSISGDAIKPFESTSIEEGDTIIELDSQEIDSTRTLQTVINNSAGRTLEIKYIKNGEICTSNIKPVQTGSNEYRLGLWVRDSASGVGTMTFYEPDSKRFAALGHGISDSDTGNLLDIETGEVVNSKIVNIIKGKKGFPGEIKGSISGQATIGAVSNNTDFGIFGELEENVMTINKYQDGINIALREEITLGEATIRATLETGQTEEYTVEITAIDLDNNTNNKSMQIKITDERLINKTGGIICGMSGAPMIQNNKLIGAITNVLVSDPETGYAVFADIMIKEMVK